MDKNSQTVTLKAEHTPLPWRSVQCAIYGPATPTGRQRSIAVCERWTGRDPQEAVADAAFIVNAVNSHAALYEAVRRAHAIEFSVTQGLERELRVGYRELLTAALALIDSTTEGEKK